MNIWETFLEEREISWTELWLKSFNSNAMSCCNSERITFLLRYDNSWTELYLRSLISKVMSCCDIELSIFLLRDDNSLIEVLLKSFVYGVISFHVTYWTIFLHLGTIVEKGCYYKYPGLMWSLVMMLIIYYPLKKAKFIEQNCN